MVNVSKQGVARMQAMPGHSMGTLYAYENFCAKWHAPPENLWACQFWGYFRPYHHLNQERFDHAYTTALLVALKVLHHVQLISCIIHQLCTSEFLSSKNYICLVARVVGFSASLIEAFRLHQSPTCCYSQHCSLRLIPLCLVLKHLPTIW